MGFLILYLLGFALFATYRFYTMDGMPSTKLVLISMFYPIEVFLFFLNFALIPFGVYLQFNAMVILNDEELEAMTDKMAQDLSDRLNEMKEDDEEKH